MDDSDLVAAETLVEGAARTTGRARLEAGQRIGRFEITGVLGQGGMGAVVRARDADLDREVAIKVLRPSGGIGLSGGEAKVRLLREARAMAKVQHPNVATVHEVGEIEGQVFIAMELVEGGTLREWIGDGRPWPEVVEMFTAIGEGLAAAHEAGLVHRDIKPENVLVSGRGAPKITDFGLVGARATPLSNPDDTGDLGLLDAALTQTGAVLGTPAYMAPEQHTGADTDARTDQFAFCVMLWEALAGARPYDGGSVGELATNVTENRREPMPERVDAPAWLLEVLDRGLAVDPAARFSSVTALIAALDRHASRRRPSRRRFPLWAAGGAAVLAGVAATLIVALGGDGAADRCRAAGEAAGERWGPAARVAVARAFAGSGAPHAGDTFGRVARALDDYAGDWASLRGGACEATYVAGEQPEALYERQAACFDQYLEPLGSLVDELSRADAGAVKRALEAALSLPRLRDCAGDVQRDAYPPSTDAGVRQKVAGLRREIAAAGSLHKLGKYDAAITRLDSVIERAAPLEYPPVLAEALGLLATVQEHAAKYAESEKTYRRAIKAASRAKNDRLMARSQIGLIWVLGYRLERPAEGRAIADTTDALLERIGRPPLAQADYLANVAWIRFHNGEIADGLRQYAESLALKRDYFNGDSVSVVRSLLNLALMHRYYYTDWKAGYAHAKEAVAMSLRLFGDDHVETGRARTELAAWEGDLGNLDEAVASMSEALRIVERHLAPVHTDVVVARYQLANYQSEAGSSRACLETISKVPEAGLSWGTAVVLWTRARCLRELGRLDEARAVLEQARALGAETYLLDALGLTAEAAGEIDEALGYFEQSVAVAREQSGAGSVDAAAQAVELGRAQLRANRIAAARATLEAAVASIAEKAAANDSRIAAANAALGEARRRAGDEPGAREAFERAIEVGKATLTPHLFAEIADAAARFYIGRDDKRARELLEAHRATGAGVATSGFLELAAGAPDKAAALCRQAREVTSRSDSPQPESARYEALCLAEVAEARGDADTAGRELAAILDGYEPAGADGRRVFARALFARARLAKAAGDRAAAAAAARRAGAIFTEVGDLFAGDRARLRAWR